MTSRAEYSQTLAKLVALLKRKPMTARAIAKHFKCGKPIVYRRIRDLVKRGHQVHSFPIRESETGPKALAYGLSR